jgi:hypothetical protein
MPVQEHKPVVFGLLDAKFCLKGGMRDYDV